MERGSCARLNAEREGRPLDLRALPIRAPARRDSLMRLLVLGAGLQGSACAYDLLQNPEVTQVRLADLHFDHLPSFLASYSGPRLIPTPLDVRDRAAGLALMRESDAAMSAIPYYFNLQLADCAVEAG